METDNRPFWEKRYEKMKEENRALREKLALLKRDINDLGRSLKNRNRLFDSIPAGVLLVQEGKIIEINPHALNELGYNKADIIDRNFLDIIDPELKAYERGLYKKRVARKLAPDRYETKLITKNGEIISCDVRVRRLRYNGRLAFIFILTGIDWRKEKEKEIILTKKMEALITMASGLNDELGPVFQAINQNLKYLEEDLDPEKNYQIKGLKEVQSAAKKAIAVTRKLAIFSKRKINRPEMVLFDLKKRAKEAVTLINARLRGDPEKKGINRNIRVKTYLRSVSPVKGEPEEIRDVIMNIIMNAADAMPEGGDIYLTSEENAGYAHIYIQDSGAGLTGRFKEKIFDPYFTTKGRNGAGMGLSLSYAIIKRHKGEIEVTSEKSQGTTVDIKLPVAKRKLKSIPISVKRQIKNARILIIEREDIIRKLLSEMLAFKGFRVVTALSGPEGLGKIKKQEFDLVMTDLQAIQPGGKFFIRKMKDINETLPVILITGNQSGVIPEGFDKSTFDQIINRPIDMNKIAGQITDVLVRKALNEYG